MHQLHEILKAIDNSIGGSEWFVFLLLGIGLFFTIYLKFPQIRYFRHAIKIVRGKFDKKSDQGDTSHFQALATALSGTIGTGNIGGVAFAIFLGGPAALFWMLVTAFLGMTTKFVEVLLSHKYREFEPDGSVAGGPMFYMKHRLNIKTKDGKTIKTGYLLGSIFAVSTVICSFGTGNLPQINNIADTFQTSFGIRPVITGAVLSVLLALVIIGGIKRIAKVTEKLVPTMAIFYFIGAFAVIIGNYENILPSIAAIFGDVFTGTAATGGFLGASFSFAFNRGVNRGLFSNEAGQGSAPIAHAAARAHEPVSEGMVAILEPFIDTIIICFLTGLTLLSSGVWAEKHENIFQDADMFIVEGIYNDQDSEDVEKLYNYLCDKKNLKLFTGVMQIDKGQIKDEVTIVHARSIAEDVMVFLSNNEVFAGQLKVENGKIAPDQEPTYFRGKSLIHSASLTTVAFSNGLFGEKGKYIVTFGLLLFAFSTAISWSYYGDRAVTYLWNTKYVVYYRIIYVLGFFVASFTDTTLIWTFSGITIALMAIPNLVGIFLLHKEVKSTISQYWEDFREEHG